MNKILYIGNDLVHQTGYFSAMEKLYSGLTSEGYIVKKISDKKKSILRLFDMMLKVVSLRNWTDIVLIDTFSTNSFYYAFIVSQLCRVLKIKYIPILHGGNLPNRLDKSKKLSQLLFKNAFRNVSPSQYLKYEFEKRNISCLLIPNSINLSELPYKQRELIQPKLLYVRAFAEIYNPSMSIKVLKILKDKYPNACLCMIGPDRDGTLESIKKLIENLNLSNSVEITGVLNRHEWYKKSEDYDIFINTTNIDNTPVSIIEAMALGIPIVSTNVGGIPYLIDHNVEGILVEKNDHKEMADAIIELIETNNFNLSAKAREKIKDYSWDMIKFKWIELLS